MTVSTEVVDAVQQLLEGEGVLNSIRAQLRASVVNALAAKDSDRRTSKAIEFALKESGRGSILCVMDLLFKLNLRETMSVFEAEIGMKYSEACSTSAKEDLIQRLNIVTALRNLEEPILYQLIETPRNKQFETGKLKTVDAYHHSESKLPQFVSKPTALEPLVTSSPSSLSGAKTNVILADGNYHERDSKRGEMLPVDYDLQRSKSTESLDDDSNDDSIAEEKKESVRGTTKDHKNQSDAKRSDLSAKHFNDSDESRNSSEDEMSIGDVIDEEGAIAEDELEVGAESGSSASFSLEYGYVEETNKEDKTRQTKEASTVINRNDEILEIVVTSALPDIAERKSPTDLGSDKSDRDQGNGVSVQKVNQGSVTRSKTGWESDCPNGDARGAVEEEEDFLFAEEPESDISSPAFRSKQNGGVESSRVTASDQNSSPSEDRRERSPTQDLGPSNSSNSSLPPPARSSWGAPIADKSDKSFKMSNVHDHDESVEFDDEDAFSVAEDEESLEQSGLGSQSGSGSLDEPPTGKGTGKGTESGMGSGFGTGNKKNNQDEEEDGDPRKTDNMSSNNNKNSGSLFLSRNQSGSLLPHGMPKSKETAAELISADISNDNSDGEEEGSVEFDADDDFALEDEGDRMRSESTKLSEVERKLAAMEKENEGFVSLRMQEDDSQKAQEEAKAKTETSSVSQDEGEYSEGDFESSSDDDNDDHNKGGIDVSQSHSQSVASEDIEEMELSVGGAGSDSDESLSGLNGDSKLKKSVEGKAVPGSGSGFEPTTKKGGAGYGSPVSSALEKSKPGDHEPSGELEFSVTEFEMSVGKGIDDDDSAYDFTAAAIPPVKSGRGPRDRQSEW